MLQENATSFVYALAWLLYPRGSGRSRLIDSVYDFTALARSPLCAYKIQRNSTAAGNEYGP